MRISAFRRSEISSYLSYQCTVREPSSSSRIWLAASSICPKTITSRLNTASKGPSLRASRSMRTAALEACRGLAGTGDNTIFARSTVLSVMKLCDVEK